MARRSCWNVCLPVRLVFELLTKQLFSVGRLKAACDLVSQYVPENLHKRLLTSYEYVMIYLISKTVLTGVVR